MKFFNTFEFEKYHEDTDLNRGVIGLVNARQLDRGRVMDTLMAVVWLDIENGTANCISSTGEDQGTVKLGLTQRYY